ncbi:hypothetical protein COSO111634_31015 [Corallococcus soli]
MPSLRDALHLVGHAAVDRHRRPGPPVGGAPGGPPVRAQPAVGAGQPVPAPHGARGAVARFAGGAGADGLPLHAPLAVAQPAALQRLRAEQPLPAGVGLHGGGAPGVPRLLRAGLRGGERDAPSGAGAHLLRVPLRGHQRGRPVDARAPGGVLPAALDALRGRAQRGVPPGGGLRRAGPGGEALHPPGGPGLPVGGVADGAGAAGQLRPGAFGADEDLHRRVRLRGAPAQALDAVREAAGVAGAEQRGPRVLPLVPAQLAADDQLLPLGHQPQAALVRVRGRALVDRGGGAALQPPVQQEPQEGVRPGGRGHALLRRARGHRPAPPEDGARQAHPAAGAALWRGHHPGDGPRHRGQPAPGGPGGAGLLRAARLLRGAAHGPGGVCHDGGAVAGHAPARGLLPGAGRA